MKTEMTVKDAKKILARCKQKIVAGDYVELVEGEAEAMQVAIDLMEYGIAKLPETDEDGLGRKYNVCPSCEAVLENVTDFCPDCGQALYWNED